MICVFYKVYTTIADYLMTHGARVSAAMVFTKNPRISKLFCNWERVLTHKQLQMLGCLLSTVATDVLVLKHQAISTHSAD